MTRDGAQHGGPHTAPPGSGGRVSPPHPLLSGYYRSAEERPGFVRDLFDRTAVHYDRVNAFMSLGWGRRYRREMLEMAGLAPGMRMLDLAIGTGQMAREARSLLAGDGMVVGLDVSDGMLAQARRTGAADHFVRGRIDHLPFADGSFDFVSLGYAVRHVADLGAAFAELARVLAKDGALLLLELTPPAGQPGRMLAKLYLRNVVPALSRLLTGSRDAEELMRYHWDTVESCVPPEAILAAMRHAGFADARTEAQFGLLRAYIGHA
ncbi:MAG TPA: class I SAM-dependent methyltransferase [Geminicoccaceae bacterium]|nr:class I SAM-dependent methyltransferase [Geminicoccus sp.]HMU51233.1 class I SAM-dependent methyltransferase [Geminicoccaceae bacterium]